MNDIERLLKVASANDLKTFLKDYARSNEAMSCMCQLHNGKQAAHQLAEFFRQEYRRRPKMMRKSGNSDHAFSDKKPNGHFSHSLIRLSVLKG